MTLLMVVAFVACVSVSRSVSIYTCWLAQKYSDLRIIEYDNLQEKRMMQRLLGGLTGVLVDIGCCVIRKAAGKNPLRCINGGNSSAMEM